jgi:histidine decarboxylase
MQKNVTAILPNVVGPLNAHCCASGLSPANAYVTTPLIGTGVTAIECSHSGSHLLDDIVAFDRAEASYANITQTNMVTVSSFNGPNGLILGYDFLKQALRRHPLIDETLYPQVYDAEPLFRATQALYGTVAEKRFPIAPGEHVLCAYKSKYASGPGLIYGALAIAIAEDRTRDADLYMEDHGTMVATHNKEANLEQQTTVIENLIRSVEKVAQNLGIRYEKIFIGLKCKNVQAGEIGCVITAAPYIHLARKAIPDGKPELLIEMSPEEWQQRVRHDFVGVAPSNITTASDIPHNSFP